MQPVAKRQKIAHVKASKITDSEWECHKPMLIDLYIGQCQTVDEIHEFMFTKHHFPANKQQYQKKFRSWKLTKNINPTDWLALSQELKHYCIALNDIDPDHGSIDVVFNSHVLAFSKVKKGIYRYDTSLLRRDKWSGEAHLAPVSKLQKILRSVITRCVIRDKSNTLATMMPKDLITLLSMISNPREKSSQSTNNHIWSLKKRSDERLIAFPTGDEQTVFISCVQSISYENNNTTALQDLNFDLLNHRWAMFLKDEVSSYVHSRTIWCKILPVMPESIKMLGYPAVTEILMVTLFYFIVLAPDLTLDTLTLSEVIEFSSLPLLGPNVLCSELLEILLFAAAGQGEIPLCEQLVATYVNVNAIRLCSLSPLHEYVDSTALQLSLSVDDNFDSTSKQGISLILLKSGADPNLCGVHGRAQPYVPICCEELPLFLALRHPSTVLRALLNAGAHVSDTLDLITAFHKIKDPEVLSILLEKGVSPGGTSSLALYSWYLCPLQAALDHQGRESALRLLEHIENGLGCSIERLQEVQNSCTGGGVFGLRVFDRDFRTPFTHAVLHHFFDIADKLLGKSADVNKSYLDYIWSDLFQWYRIRQDLSAVHKYIFSASARPLQAAISKDDLAATQFLLNVGADPNYSRANELSALATAMWRWNEPIITLLREHDALLSLQDLFFFIIITRREKHKLTESATESPAESDLYKNHTKHLNKRLNVLGRMIEEIKLEQSECSVDTLIRKRCHVPGTQFQRLLEAW